MTHEQNLCDQVLTVLRRIISAIDRHSSHLVQHHGLTGPQLVVMQEVNRLNEVSVGHLAKNVSLSNATVTDILDRLEKRGFVQRNRSDSDKRRVLIRLTEQGVEMLQGAPSLLQDRFVEAFENLQGWEQTLILSSLQRIASMMEPQELDVALKLINQSLPAVSQTSQQEQPVKTKKKQSSRQNRCKS